MDTTAGPSSCQSFVADTECTRSAGTNTVTNYAISCKAAGGDKNYCVFGSAGDGTIRIDDGAAFGPTQVTTLSASDAVHLATTLTVIGATAVGALSTTGDIQLTKAADINLYASRAATAGTQNVNIDAAGSGVIRLNSNTGGFMNAGSGGVQLFGGQRGTTAVWTATGTGHVLTGGTIPTLLSCGTGPTLIGSDMAGTVTLGATAVACTVKFASTYGTAPSCTV